jgi:hypothetical protein
MAAVRTIVNGKSNVYDGKSGVIGGMNENRG